MFSPFFMSLPEVLLEPLHEQVECVVVLFAEPEPVRGHGHELMPRLVARTVAQQEFTWKDQSINHKSSIKSKPNPNPSLSLALWTRMI